MRYTSIFFDEIVSKSGDWYWGEPVTDGFAKISKKLDEVEDKISNAHGIGREKVRKALWKEESKLKQDLLTQVMEDIGVENLPDNRTALEPILFWD